MNPTICLRPPAFQDASESKTINRKHQKWADKRPKQTKICSTVSTLNFAACQLNYQ